MDEVVKSDLDKVRQNWASHASNTGKAKRQRRNVERSVDRTSTYWTGRSAQMNIRMTPEVKEDVHRAAAELGMSMADFFESAVLAFISSKRGKP